MIVEDRRTKCPRCLKPLTWLSHSKQWTPNGDIEEFTFRCDRCKVEYVFKNDELRERRRERDPLAERLAVERIRLHEVATSRLCPNCGGSLTDSPHAWVIWCSRCHQEYRLVEGELQARAIGEQKPKPMMREFYALHEKR